MNKALIYLLSVILFLNTIYHFRIRQKCIYLAQLTKGMAVVLVIIPIVFLSLAYIVGNGLEENVVVAVAVSSSMISRIVGRGISEEGIYYWTKTGVNRLASWENIKKVDVNHSKNRVEKIRFQNYARYMDQYYPAKDIRKIDEYIQRRI